MLLAAGEAQAYIAMAGGVVCTIITGWFGLKIAARTKSTGEDTVGKLDLTLEKVNAFEALFVEWQRERRARELYEARADRLAGQVQSLRRQLVAAGIEPGADS